MSEVECRKACPEKAINKGLKGNWVYWEACHPHNITRAKARGQRTSHGLPLADAVFILRFFCRKQRAKRHLVPQAKAPDRKDPAAQHKISTREQKHSEHRRPPKEASQSFNQNIHAIWYDFSSCKMPVIVL